MLSLRTQSLFKRKYPDGLPVKDMTSEQLSALQHVLSEVAHDVISVFESYGLDYCLYAGTALGAIRHGDFIPWDDDFDLAMPRNDLERFIEIFDKELGDRYWLVSPGITSGCRAPMTKVVLKGTVLRDRNSYYDEKCGVFIDIFPYETVPAGKLARQLYKLRALAAGFAASCRWFYEDRQLYRDIVGSDREALIIVNIKIAIGKLLSPISLDYWVQHAYRVWGSCRTDNSGMIAVIPRWDETLSERSSVFPGKRVKFGEHFWRVPADYDRSMRAFFNDYLTLPPIEERESHGYYEFQFDGA